ncbi:MAG: winged helix-turn-helix domain-containing protein [Desulfarculaceae bacterium]|nr:winged helix-turn-helix domain-containing protein [Desulfarculaceae bacterium]MCF8072369.1 winged helix-turn-helix domain-containing protein [Desulfarculaceae bacterium]MCF8100290.1 winged helix-turn-helix domain-containing protein [Desulfarculaceae bacterium]MCF8116137.1 winged helix-turn-helix domain-containing protein [Desulfarculaceae bacterium]
MAKASAEDKKVLKALSGSQEPMSNKQVAESAGLESKKVSTAMSALKKAGMVESPVRCKYSITADGKKALKG